MRIISLTAFSILASNSLTGAYSELELQNMSDNELYQAIATHRQTLSQSSEALIDKVTSESVKQDTASIQLSELYDELNRRRNVK